MPYSPNFKKKASPLKAVAIYGGLGLSLTTELVVSGLLGCYLGIKIQKYLPWLKPWAMIFLILVFLTMSFFHIVMVLKQVQKQMLSKEEKSL